MRYSRQRELIYETLESFDTHPTAEQIYLHVKKKMPSISLGTVYRNLNLLVELGKIRKVDSIDSSSTRYDARNDEHSHLYCLNCKKVIDIDLDFFKPIDAEIKKEFGFEVQEHDIVLKGICSDCQTN